ncbi:MAG: maleylpyruvate isomerase family mycothiol-dependent enzyme, partial [Actinomycetota bacterium]
VNGLFRPDRDALVDLLRGLDAGQWDLPTVCEGWSVKDVALHVLGGDLGNIAGRRDGLWALQPEPGETMGVFIGRINRQWVEAARRMTPRLIVELLEWSGPRLFEHLEQLDPMGTSGEVSWAAPGPAPVWLDVAREYTERWLHQQHIRDAVGVPGQRDSGFLGPVVATFVHALPMALKDAAAPAGSRLQVDVRGEGGGTWTVVRAGDDGPLRGWELRAGSEGDPAASVSMDTDTAWRLLTLGLDEEAAAARVRQAGDATLTRCALRAVAIIA